MTFTHVLAALIGLSVLAVLVWESSIYIDERNKLRKFTGEYYDFDIRIALKQKGYTWEQALKEMNDKSF